MQLAQSSMGTSYCENPGAFYVAAMVNEIFSIGEQEKYWQTVALFDSCFTLAKQNKIPESKIKYEECCSTKKTLSPDLLDWLMSFYGQRLCYYNYKLKNYGSSIALTIDITKSVRSLQQKGFQYLFFVEIQQQLNLSKIYFELDETDKAIALCTDSILAMHGKAGNFSINTLIKDIPENELIEITQYGMIIEVLSEACNKIISKLKADPDKLEKSILLFIEPLLKLDFASLSPNPRYECIDKFVSLMGGLGGYSELLDDDILFLMNTRDTDKKLLDVLNNCMALIC